MVNFREAKDLHSDSRCLSSGGLGATNDVRGINGQFR